MNESRLGKNYEQVEEENGAVGGGVAAIGGLIMTSNREITELNWEYNGKNAVWATYCDLGAPRSDFHPPDIFICRLDGAPKDLKKDEIDARCPREKNRIGSLIANAPKILSHLKKLTEVVETICPYEFNGNHDYMDEFDSIDEGLDYLIEECKAVISRVESASI